MTHPPAATTTAKRLRFGPFQLDTADQTLRRDGEVVPVPPKVYEVLRFFVERPGRLIRREDLLAGVWQGVSVSDQALTQMLRKVRVALGDDTDEPRLLKTVYGRGYRFIGVVDLVSPAPEPAGVALRRPPRPQDHHFGHGAELARLRALHTDGVRMISLVGAPGVGKSRLAAEFAVALGEPTEGDDVAWVDLTGVREDADLVSAVAAALGGPPELRLADGGAPRVVFLDQTDGVVEALASRVSRWIQAYPGTTFIGTGREAIRIAGEVVCPVRPLAVPEAGASHADVSDSPAVALFVDRAQAVLPEYTLTDADAAAVAALVAQLDGLPLAIELAAARVRSLPPRALLDRLEHRFDLLQSPRRDLPERHRSLRGSVASSWDALPDWAREALRTLATLEGAWSLEEGEALLGRSAPGVPAPCAIIDALFGRSLLRASAGEEAARYRVLECVRAYARDPAVG